MSLPYIIDPSPRYMAMPFKPKKGKTYDRKITRVYPVLGGECFEAIYLGAMMSDEEKTECNSFSKETQQKHQGISDGCKS